MKVLIAKANQLGDNVVFLPVVQELLRRIEPQDVHLLTSPIAAEIYRGLIPSENLWTVPTAKVLNAWKNPARFFRFLKRWRSIRPDAVLLPFDQGNVPRLTAWLAGTPLRIGAENPSVRTDRFLSHRLRFVPESSVAVAEWRLGRLFARITGLNDGFDSLEPPAPDLSHLTGKVRREPRAVLIHPGASLECKRWPVERFVELANRLSKTFSVSWVDPDAKSPVSKLDRAIERLPRMSLAGFTAKLAGCGLFVGNNSGPMNLAAAVATPSVIFAGPALRRWDPFWNADRNLILRSPDLSCQPCARPVEPLTACANLDEPLACLHRWTAEAVENLAVFHWRRCWASRSTEMAV